MGTMINSLVAFALSITLAAEAPRDIKWADLLPDEEKSISGPVVDHDGAPLEQTGSSSAVAALDGVEISMPGFMLPLDYTEKGRVSAFLLVPYYGACIHVPPPPPNQIVYVDTQGEPVESRGLWDPVTVTGTMTVRRNENGLGDAAYTLLLADVQPYKP